MRWRQLHEGAVCESQGSVMYEETWPLSCVVYEGSGPSAVSCRRESGPHIVLCVRGSGPRVVSRVRGPGSRDYVVNEGIQSSGLCCV